MFLFHPIKTVKKLISLIIFIALVFLVVNFWAIRDWAEYFLLNKYPRAESLLEFVSKKTDIQINSEQYFLTIEKIRVKAPVVLAVSADDSELQKSLKSGVVLYPDTAMPGEVGNTVITGHSSDYFWKEGEFKTVFSLLPNLAIGDQIKLSRGNESWLYEVESEKMVSDKDMSVLESNNDQARLTLITCWPPGTSFKRWVVTAKLVQE